MRRIQNQDELFIMNGTISSHVPDGTSFASSALSLLEDGEVVLVDMSDNTVHNAAFPTSGLYRFYGRAGTSLLMSNVFDAATVTKTERAYSAQTEQVDYVGYNGTSGSMDASTAKNEIFTLHIEIIGATRTDFNQIMIKEGHYITTSTSTAQWAIAQGITTSLISNFSRFPNPVMRFERVNDEAMTALGTGTGTAAVVYGSNIVTFATDVDDATVNAALAVGKFIRFGTGVTDSTYLITAMDTVANTITLDVPYQGVSNATVANVAMEAMTNATGIAAEWGIKLTGIAQPYAIQKYPPQVIRWNAFFTKIDATAKEATPTATVTNSVGAVLGTGTYAQVAEMERELQMGDGYQMYSDIPMPDYRGQANSAKTYNLVHIKHVKNMTSHLGQEVPSLCGVTLALDIGLTYGAQPAVKATITGAISDTGMVVVTVNGVPTNYAITWDTSDDKTMDDFETAHSTALTALGVTVTALPATATYLLFTGTDGMSLQVSYYAVVGTMTATIENVSSTGWNVFGFSDDSGTAL